MRAALQAAMEKGFFEEDGKQPMAGACRQNQRNGHRMHGGIKSDLSLNRPKTRSIFRFGRTEFFLAFHLIWSHKGRSRVAKATVFQGQRKTTKGGSLSVGGGGKQMFAEMVKMAGANNKLETLYRSMVVL
jgi:hypothetical protein